MTGSAILAGLARTGRAARAAMWLLAAVTLAGCGSIEDPGAELPTTPPVITGTIVGAGDLGSQLVVANPVAPIGSCDLRDRAQVRFTGSTIMTRSGAAASGADLTVGRMVSVWTTLPILDTCPAIVSATTVVIEDGAGAADRVAGRSYVVRLHNGVALPAPAQWRQRDGRCAAGTLVAASLSFLSSGQLELRMQADGGGPASLVVTSYAQANPGVVTGPEVAGVAIARHDSLLVPLAEGNPLLCASAGRLHWIAVASG
ncbi:MAG TPA: hypothetical protein VGE02_12815 [Gemmatimonadales bacterium]